MPIAAVPNRKLEQGSRSRERILDAASRLMAGRGYAATSISEISAACGLPASSIYWHFDSKEGLLSAVMERGADQWFAGLPAWRKMRGVPEERLKAALDVIVRSLEEEPEFLRLYLLLALERREVDSTSLGTIRRVREKAIGRVRTMLAEVLAPAGEPLAARVADGLSRFLLAFADGCFVAHHIDGRRAGLRRLFEDLAVGLIAIARSHTTDPPQPVVMALPKTTTTEKGRKARR
jgi:AcrR family transcriptional regulator